MSRKPTDAPSKEKNEYIPNFIANKPFYLESADTESDYLEHQRLQNSVPDQSNWYDRGKRLGPAATKFRKGACENCGAMTHKTKECLSRPRAKGARWTGQDIQADEVVQKVDLGWDAKRDRWNGYDASEYRAVVDEFEELENLKKQMKTGLDVDVIDTMLGDETDPLIPPNQEEAKYAEESDMGRQQSTATRNLRLREDTAKYLLNLDLDSAKYDPKTRSMVDMGAQPDQAAALVAEDNFMRASGDAAEFERAQRYAWESQERGNENKQHLQANPTSGEYFRKKEKEESETRVAARKKMLVEKYGGGEYKSSKQVHDLITECEHFVEYDDDGTIKDAPKVAVKSKYPEDIFVNNHTSVWGSWWKNFEWGYACCHSTVRNSYCTGEHGRLAFEEARRLRTADDVRERTADEELEDEHETSSRTSPRKVDKDFRGKVAKKRTLIELQAGVSEEDLEAYKRSRIAADDPMSKMMGKDELVH